MAVRGLASVIVNGIPDETQHRRGLLVLSCSDKVASAIQTVGFGRYKNVTWTVIRRNPPIGESSHENTLYSTSMNSLASRVRLIRDLRRKRFDVVAVAWTGERSYTPLKVFSLFTNFGALLALKEDGDSFNVVRPNLRRLVSHGWMRWRTREKHWGAVAYRLGSVLLIPLGLLVLLVQVIRYTFVKILASAPDHRGQ